MEENREHDWQCMLGYPSNMDEAEYRAGPDEMLHTTNGANPAAMTVICRWKLDGQEMFREFNDSEKYLRFIEAREQGGADMSSARSALEQWQAEMSRRRFQA